MLEALKQAQIAYDLGEVPVGAVITQRLNGKIIAKAHNMMQTSGNPLKHAEMIVIDMACKKLGNKNLSNCDLYVSLEPCAMCASAVSHSRLGRLFYGASDQKQGAVENGVRFFTNTSCHWRPEVYHGMLFYESQELMQNFFKRIRNDGV